MKKQAASNHLTYTVVACGAFLDWGLSTGFAGLSFQVKTASIFGDGTNVVPWTKLEDVGKAIANVLSHQQEMLSRPVYVHPVFMSQNQLFGAAKKALGNEGWTVTYNDMEALLQKALADLKSGSISDATFIVQIQYCLATKALARPWARDDSPLTGLREWDQEKVGGRLIQTIANKTV